MYIWRAAGQKRKESKQALEWTRALGLCSLLSLSLHMDEEVVVWYIHCRFSYVCLLPAVYVDVLYLQL